MAWQRAWQRARKPIATTWASTIKSFISSPQTQAPQAPTPLEGEIGAQFTQVGAAHRRLQRGQSTALAAKVQTGGRDLRGGLEVAFYDGDPRVDGTLIGLQYLPHLYANRTHDFRVLFTPQHCGRRTVYVVAGNGTRHEHTAKLPPIVVAGEECTARRAALRRAGVPPHERCAATKSRTWPDTSQGPSPGGTDPGCGQVLFVL